MSRPSARGADANVLRGQALALVTSGHAEQAVTLLVDTISRLDWEVRELQRGMDQLLKRHLGCTSERISPDQLDMFLRKAAPADAATTPAQATEELRQLAERLDAQAKAEKEEEEAKGNGPKKKDPKKHGRRPLPEHLERRRVEIAPDPDDCVCAACAKNKIKIGEEKSETLGMEPATFYVNQYVRPKLACPNCDEAHISIAPVADKVIEGGLPEADLLAHVLVGKYNDHCPLHRLHRIYLRYGVDVAVSTLMDWVTSGHEMLKPLVLAIARACILAHVLQVDDTGIKVLDSAAPRGSKRGHLWAYVGDGRYVTFQYTEDWKGEHPREFLADRIGPVQADAYKGLDALFDMPLATAVEIACWAHARRYWVEALDAGDERAALPLKLIQHLYRIERIATDRRLTPEQRRGLRQERARPILDALQKWLAQMIDVDPPKSLFAKAVGYATRQWAALCRYVEDGLISIDNTGAERALRSVVCGRKNYLFCGSDAGAERAATMYTILGTCRLNGVEPLAYLTDVLRKLAAGWPSSRIDELLPPKWIEAHPEHRLGLPAPIALPP